MGLLDTMKKVAENTNAAGAPTAWFFGKVTKTSPLTIRVDNRFDISGEAIVVPKELQAGYYPTHYHTGMKAAFHRREGRRERRSGLRFPFPRPEEQLPNQHRQNVGILLRTGRRRQGDPSSEPGRTGLSCPGEGVTYDS